MIEYDIIYTRNATGDLQRISVEFARRTRAMCLAASRKCGIESSALQQLYRSSTSVGANIREAQYAESPKDFVHKLKIGEKELGESFYWLGLLTAEPMLLPPEIVSEISVSATSLVKLLSVIITKTKQRIENS